MGLAVALAIIRGHGGTIDVHSRPHQGTTVRVVLPSTEGAPDVMPVPASPIYHACPPGDRSWTDLLFIQHRKARGGGRLVDSPTPVINKLTVEPVDRLTFDGPAGLITRLASLP